MHKKLSHGCCYCAITIGNCNNSRKPLNPPTLTISSFTTFVSDFDKDWLQTLISSDILNQPSPSDKSTFDNWRSAGDLTWSNKVLSATLISLFSNYTRSFNCVECFSLWMGVLNRRYSVRFWRGIVGDFFLVVGNKTWTLWHSVGGGRGCKTAAEMGAAIELEIWRIPLEITLFHFPQVKRTFWSKERGRERGSLRPEY